MSRWIDLTILFIRIIIAWRLIGGVYPYLFNFDRITEVVDYFQALQLPLPMLSAYASVYAQFVCGLLLAVGAWVRTAALVLALNFVVAILFAHLQDSVVEAFPALIILANNLFFALYGPGRYAMDNRWFGKGKEIG